MREESPWIRLRQGIRRDILRVIDRLASIRGQPWPPFPSRLKVILLFIGAGLSVFVVFYVSGVRFQFLTPHVGPLLGAVLGFASGWGLFEISEHRRRRRQQQTIREALKAELSNMERVLNLQVMMYSRGMDDPGRGVQETRWFYTEGLRRGGLLGEPVPSDLSPQAILELSDDELAKLLSQLPAQQPNLAVDLPLPVLRAALAAPTAGFTSVEIQRLSWVQWQTHMLAHEARMLHEMVMLTYTVSDPNKHRLVTGNVESAKRAYRMRAGHTLDAVREALKAIEN
jgi:hypothetical protein